MCFRFAGKWQRGHVGFCCAIGWHSWQMAGHNMWLINLVWNASMFHNSFQENFLFSTPSHLNYCPCFASEMTLTQLAACSCQHNFLSTRPHCWDGVTLYVLSKAKASSSLLHVANGVPVLEVNSSLFPGWEQFGIISNLILVCFYCSETLEMGSSRLPFP